EAIRSDVTGSDCRLATRAIHSRIWIAIVSRLFALITVPGCNYYYYNRIESRAYQSSDGPAVRNARHLLEGLRCAQAERRLDHRMRVYLVNLTRIVELLPKIPPAPPARVRVPDED